MSLFYWLLNLNDPGAIEGVTAWELVARSALSVPVLVLIAAAGLAAACLNFMPHVVLRRGRRLLLFALRLIGLAAVLALVLQLEANLSLRRSKKPQVAVIVDTSESMALKDCPQGSRLAAALNLAEKKIEPALAGRAQLEWYQADWQLRPGRPAAATEPAGPTDLGQAVQRCIDESGSPRAILLLSDGKTAHADRIADAARIAKQSGVQVFAISLGKPGKARAVSIRVTQADNYVRLGDEFVISTDVRAEGVPGQTLNVLLFEDDDKAPRMQRAIQLGDKPVPVTFRYRPTRPGRHRYRVEVARVKGADTDLTNVVTTAVEVIDDPIRVLYVEGTPRFELKFLNIWLARDPVIDLTTVTRMPKGGWFTQGKRRHDKMDEGFPITEAELFDYDVVIFGDIPRGVFRQGGDLAETRLVQIVNFVVKRGGGLITTGGQSVYGAGLYQGSALDEILPFRIDGLKKQQLTGYFIIEPVPAALTHPVMALAADATASREAWFDMPRLDGCNAVGTLKPAATLLALRQIDDKTYPVIATHAVGRGRVLSLTCDTTWHWEMQRKDDDTDNYRKFWGRAVRYVAADPRTRPGRPSILAQSSRPVVGTEFPLTTTLLDPNYGPVRNADIRVEVTEPSGRKYLIYPSDSSDSPGVYRYSVPLREKGVHTVKAEYQGTATEQEIIAGDAAAEMDDAGADPASLRLLARETGGREGSETEADSLLAAIPLQPEHYDEKVTVTLWNLPLLAALLIAVVCVDCYIRKRSGLV